MSETDFSTELDIFEKEMEDMDPIKLLTPNEILDTIQIFDSTVEIIGYIDGIESPRIVGNKQQYKVFKFFLNNGNGKRIQVIAWNDDIEHIIHHVVPNHIIHLDGLQARNPKVTAFNHGNVPYELLIRKNTIIANLGKYDPIPNPQEKPISIKLNEILSTTGRVILDAYVKSNFYEAEDNRQNKIIGYGSITDGFLKLEVHIVNFTNNSYFDLAIHKGDKIQIIGVLQSTIEPIYLLVNNIQDIRKLKGRMEFSRLMKSIPIIKKRKIEENLQEKEKKRNSI